MNLFNSSSIRHKCDISLCGIKAKAEINTLFCARANQKMGLAYRVYHCSDETTAICLSRNTAAGKSEIVFNGEIVIDVNTKKTRSYLMNNNILLSKNSRIFTCPKLKINSEDTKCTHGATVEPIESNLVFYLQTRGFGKNIAKTVLKYSFVNGILEKSNNKQIKKYLKKALIKKNFSSLRGLHEKDFQS